MEREKVTINNLQDLLDRRKKQQLLLHVFEEIKFTRKSMGQYAIASILAIFLGLIIAFAEETVSFSQYAFEQLNTICIAFISIVLGAYAIFQALLDESILLKLLESDNNMLKESNKTFLNLVVLYVVAILINMVMSIVLEVMPEEYLLTGNIFLDEIICLICLTAIFMFEILLILEMINFTVNLYRMFSVYNTMKAIDAINKTEREEISDEEIENE